MDFHLLIYFACMLCFTIVTFSPFLSVSFHCCEIVMRSVTVAHIPHSHTRYDRNMKSSNWFRRLWATYPAESDARWRRTQRKHDAWLLLFAEHINGADRRVPTRNDWGWRYATAAVTTSSSLTHSHSRSMVANKSNNRQFEQSETVSKINGWKSFELNMSAEL